MKEDIFEAARAKISADLIHTMFDSDGSFSRNGNYFIKSPLRHDSNVGSFKIDEYTGVYYDFAHPEDTGDFITLVSLSKGISLADAARDIIKEGGGVFVNTPSTNKKKTKKNTSPPVIPIQDTDENKKSLKKRVQDPWCLEHWGTPETISRYFNEKKEWVFCVVRFTKKAKIQGHKREKNDILFYLGVDGKWWTSWHDDLKPFPPYGIEKIIDSKLPILIVEGEKCGRCKVPGYNVISWLGGTSNMDKTNWKLIRDSGVPVFIWPDADSSLDKNKEYYLPEETQAGMKAAYYIKSQVPRAKILEVYKYLPLEEDPHGLDIFDIIEDGKDPVKFIEDFTPYHSIDVEIDPYQVYRKFIDDYYDNDSLDQANGGYWNYYKDEHFWRPTMKTDILCNLQRWFEETGLQWVVSKKKKVTSFINDVKQYIERHSVGYATGNPFKDAAVSPYIHLMNGAIKISDNGIGWLSREKYGDDYFKKLYPINCLDFSFDYPNYNKIDPKKDCPGFYFFCKEVIPHAYMDTLTPDQKEDAILETVHFFGQIIAYSLSPVKPNEYFFGIYGNERTGKSFFLKILKSIVGSEFCVERRIADMDNRFSSSVLWGKKVFIEPDLKAREPLPDDFIKQYAGDQEITAEAKNMPAVHGVKTSLALFFVSNYEFHTSAVEGLARRMIMIPYKNTISKHDHRLLDKITGKYPHGKESDNKTGSQFDERPAILSIAMQGWDKFCQNDSMLILPKWAQDEKDTWALESNSVAKFMEEKYFSQASKVTEQRTEIYNAYKEWCGTEGRKPLGKKNFYEEVRRDDRTEENNLSSYRTFTFNVAPPEVDEIPF